VPEITVSSDEAVIGNACDETIGPPPTEAFIPARFLGPLLGNHSLFSVLT